MTADVERQIRTLLETRTRALGRRDAATAAARDAVLEYAREHLAVEPRVVETVYCTPTPGLGDGFRVQHEGRVVAVHGENLFKLAPVLGTALAQACERS